MRVELSASSHSPTCRSWARLAGRNTLCGWVWDSAATAGGWRLAARTGAVSIHDARTFRRVVQLPTQNGGVEAVAFQPNGSGLAQGGMEEMITFWDLSRIELALTANGLGWKEEPPDSSSGTSQTHPASRIPWVRGRAKAYESLIWFLQQALETNPDQADLCVELAWIQVMGPTRFRDATKALTPEPAHIDLVKWSVLRRGTHC